MRSKVILFGGTFDPIHLGHTCVCLYAMEQLRAEKLVFIPAKRSPHKQMPPLAGDNARVEMIRLAIADEKRFEVNDCELKRPSPSYTVDTVKFFRSEYGKDAKLYWLVGADAVQDLAKWYKIETVIDECNLCIISRGGFEKPDFEPLKAVLGHEPAKMLAKQMISGPLLDISSCQIRRRVAAAQPISDLVQPSVEAYIEENGLYKEVSSG